MNYDQRNAKCHGTHSGDPQPSPGSRKGYPEEVMFKQRGRNWLEQGSVCLCVCVCVCVCVCSWQLQQLVQSLGGLEATEESMASGETEMCSEIGRAHV